MTNNKKQIFLNEVTDQIKSMEARKFVSDELNYHIKKAKKTWEEKGLTETEAEEKAVMQMGNPSKLGIQLNKLHHPKVDWWMVALLVTTLILSFLPMFSLGYMENGMYFLKNKFIIVFLGGLVALGIMMIDYRKWKKQGRIFYILGVLILLVLLFLSNRMFNGNPLLVIGPLKIKSLMAIPFFFLAWAAFFNNEKLKIWQFILLFFIPLLLFMEIPSTSPTFMYTIMVFVMLWWSKFSRKTVGTIIAIVASSFLIVGIASLTFLKEYQKVRLYAFLNPEKYADGSGYLILRSKELLGMSGWFGNSNSKEFIPDAHTDLVFVTFTYYYGWLFAIALVFILSLFVARIILVLYQVKDSYGKLLLIGAVALYAVQLTANIAMSLGFFPLLSISLPFISYGFMPTLLNAVLMGIVLSVYRRKDLVYLR